MGSLTQQIPKPMLLVHGRPMLDHILEHLEAAGVVRFLIVVGFQGDTIRAHFEKTNPPSQTTDSKERQIEFVRQNPVNGTGSGALLARPFVGGQPLLLSYGDILCDPSEYRRTIDLVSADPQTAASVAVKAVDDPWQGAAVYEQGGRISRIVEKPPKGTSTTSWNSAGFYAFRPVIFDYLAKLEPSPRGEYELTSALAAMLADGLDLRISPVEGPWRDVGRPEDLAAMNA